MRTLLIVDDDLRICRSLSRLFAVHGFDVTTACSVDEALAALRIRAVDVVLTDLQMPDRNGVELLLALPAVAPSARAVLMTGVTSHREVARALEAGALAVLEKPFEVAELLHVLDGQGRSGTA